MIRADIIVDLQYGDCAKGKVAHHLCKKGKYTHVLRYNGGCNAGHTIYHEGKKFIMHHIPAGVFFGIPSVIGSGCVLDPERFFAEIEELEKGGISTSGKIFIAWNTHIIQPHHIGEDDPKGVTGTTKRGNGPAYRDKYARVGKRAFEVSELAPFLVDMYEILHRNGDVHVLCEGAQGFGLDIDWGDYPYVTSSHCTSGSALMNGIPWQSVRNVWGVAKIYETYAGEKKFEPDDPIFPKIREIGDEYGSTTDRPRQCNWLNMDLLRKAIAINGVTHVVISKMDVLREVNRWELFDDGKTMCFINETRMKNYIKKRLAIPAKNIFFSEHKDSI
ncbi:MAG: adenylosuccinate synthase [Parcubacteria group bacterium Greene1014_15]|nr:MAG: adenylosuccinate synthase [Parcubacteria group bacterium Greene1014_15]